jgi:hypothetical protein
VEDGRHEPLVHSETMKMGWVSTSVLPEPSGERDNPRSGRTGVPACFRGRKGEKDVPERGLTTP